ncbi:LacI family DNA-binding transcriptional regulator [Cohnella sp. JJ-181]|uniref:LacI family DNA-binding transcriptional regulator n=1 Tax=Cohnella rhizoplanae TaxID=2974897 RepID=UPI0022FFC3DB|nr:LacI family DNA-binding transcriptional regulator [Cohnella sp. JJ-181]CAI6087611.1 Catabolite control protein A [Cohnella sp. JJ-181]
MATRREVAELAGVSEATVSRVMNGVGPIKEETRLKVTAAAAQLGYQLNALASGFARGRSGNIGVVLPHVPKVRLFSTYYFSEILSGIGDVLHQAGYGLLLLYRNPQALYDYVSLYRTRRVDACLILGASALPVEQASVFALADESLPCCVVDQRYGRDDLPCVGADHRAGAYAAVRYMLDAGLRRIGFLNGSPHYSNSADRYEGYRQALAESGLSPDPATLFEGNYSRKSGYESAGAIYERLGELDGLLCANDRMAIGAIQGLRERGVDVPGRLPVVGYDNSDASSLSDPPLTTVDVPFYEMGRLAAESVLSRLAGVQGEPGDPGTSGAAGETTNDDTKGHGAADVLLPTQLIIRRSC